MNKTTIVFALCLSAFAADTKAPERKPSSPEPIPAAEQENISRQMLTVQMHANRIAQLQLQAEQAKKEFEEASKSWEMTLSGLREKYHGAGCDLSLEKVWVCPPAKKN